MVADSLSPIALLVLRVVRVTVSFVLKNSLLDFDELVGVGLGIRLRSCVLQEVKCKERASSKRRKQVNVTLRRASSSNLVKFNAIPWYGEVR